MIDSSLLFIIKVLLSVLDVGWGYMKKVLLSGVGGLGRREEGKQQFNQGDDNAVLYHIMSSVMPVIGQEVLVHNPQFILPKAFTNSIEILRCCI